MGKLNTTPTGCPGPIAGTRVWRCDGENCVYGKSHYASCKQAIAERGYTLRLSSDLVEEAAEAARLIEQNVQGKLAEEQADKLRIIKKAEDADAEYRARLTTEMFKTQAQEDIGKEFANLYYEQMMFREVAETELHMEIELNGSLMRTNADLNIDLRDSCEHCATLLQRIAELEDELLWYKQKVAGNVEENTSMGTDNTDNCDNDSSVLDSGSTGGEA